MASQSIADFAVKIGIQGEEALQGLGKEVAVLTKSVKVVMTLLREPLQV